MKAAASLSPTSNAFAQMEEQPVPRLAIGDPERSVFKQQLERKDSAAYSCPSLIEVLDVCPKDIFHNINGLLQIGYCSLYQLTLLSVCFPASIG